MKRVLAILIVVLFALVPSLVLADAQFPTDTAATLYTTVKDGAGNPVNNATVTVTLRDSTGTAVFSDEPMVYLAGSWGKYGYDFTSPEDEGNYIAESYAVGYGYGSETVVIVAAGNVTCPGNFTGMNPLDEDLSGYTDPNTLGGLLNAMFGGDSMLNGIIGILLLLSIVMLAIYLWKREMWLGITAGVIWSALAIYVLAVYEPSTPELTTMWFGLGWLFVAVALAILVAPMTWNKTRDEIWEEAIDPDTGEPIMEEYRNGNKTGQTRELTDLEKRERTQPKEEPRKRPSRFSEEGRL